MPSLVIFNGALLLKSGSLASTEGEPSAECCCGEDPCACPDLEALCISATLLDRNGSTISFTESDFTWYVIDGEVLGSASDASGEYTLTISCDSASDPPGITLSAGWTGVVGNCICTSGGGLAFIQCTGEEGWYAQTASFDIEYDNYGLPCDGDCPASLGSLSITLSAPPC